MQSTAMPMVGVRLYPEQVETIRRIAGERHQTPSLILREFIAAGLAANQTRGAHMPS